jgi:hypothetical protein
MSSCMEELSTLVRTEASSTSLKFLDLMIGGFEAEELELIVPSPGPKTHVFVFVRDGGSWTEVKSCVQEDGGQLRLKLPAGPLRHIAIAFIP